MTGWIATAARYVISMLLAVYVIRQCRKPSSVVGRFFARHMNASHAALTRWGLSHVEVGPNWAILDIGCGGGRTIETLASKTSGIVCGLDYSSASVAVARERNRAAIESGRVRIEEGSVSALPFAAETFDLATAVETHYYWPHLSADVREVVRVLKPSGAFMIIAEAYRGRRHDWLFRPVMQLLLGATYLTPEQHRTVLADAGCDRVEVFVEEARGWICAVGYV
jgi:ubiquinone/menaquinone biosynthesis C-methylase UbiE